jgi:hypothetical protein
MLFSVQLEALLETPLFISTVEDAIRFLLKGDIADIRLLEFAAAIRLKLGSTPPLSC